MHRVTSVMACCLMLGLGWFALTTSCSASVAESQFALGRAFGVTAECGGQEVELLWDTGSEYSFLTNRAVRDLHVGTGPLAIPIDLRDSRGLRRMVKIQAVDVDVCLFEGKPNPMCLPMLEDPGEWFEFHGIVGRDVMLEWDWIVDCPRGIMLRVARGSLRDRVGRRASLEGRVPMRITRDGFWVKVKIGRGLEVDARLDTGSWRTLLPAQMISDLNLPIAKNVEIEQVAREARQLAEAMKAAGVQVGTPELSASDNIVGVHGSGGPAVVYLLDALEFGSATENNILVSESTSEAVVVGADVLRRWRWALDSGALSIWVLKE